MLRKFWTKLNEREEDFEDLLLPVTMEPESKSWRTILVGGLRIAIVICTILLILEHNKYEELKLRCDFNRAVNIVVNVEEEIRQYKMEFDILDLKQFYDEVVYYEKKIHLATTIEELDNTIYEYYNWKVFRGLIEGPEFI